VYKRQILNKYKSRFPEYSAEANIGGDSWFKALVELKDYSDFDIDFANTLGIENLEILREFLQNMEEGEVTVNEQKVLDIQDRLTEMEGVLKKIEASSKSKQVILDYLQNIHKKWKQDVANKTQLKKDSKIADEIESTLDEGTQSDHSTKVYEASSKKTNRNVRWGTIASSVAVEKGIEHAIRAQRFGNRFQKLKEKLKFKGRIVTQKTEGGYMDGLAKALYSEHPEEVIAYVVTDEKGRPVDEFGVVIPEGGDLVGQAIYQMFPADNLEQIYDGNKETMFRETDNKGVKITKAFIKQQVDEHKAWRADTLNATELDKLHNIGASFGIIETIKDSEGNRDYDARSNTNETGLADNDVLETKHSVTVATTNQTISHGTVSFNTPLGRVFLKVPGGLVKLYNKKFSQKEANVIYDVLHQITKNTLEDKSAKEKRTIRLFTWLKSTVFWGIQKDKDTGKENYGLNSIWFESVEVNGEMESTLKFGNIKESFSFTPEALEANKERIIAQIMTMYNNTNASMTTPGVVAKPYIEIIGLNKKGEPITVEWPNYQSYLLADKSPNEDGDLKVPRKNEDIPLKTNVKVLEGEEDTNKKGIYFMMTDNSASQVKGDPKQEVKKTEKDGKTTTVFDWTLTKDIINSYTMTAYGNISFKFDGPGIMKLIASLDEDVLTDQRKRAALIKQLVDDGLITVIPSETRDAKIFGMLTQTYPEVEITDGDVVLILAKDIFNRAQPMMNVEVVEKKLSPEKKTPKKVEEEAPEKKVVPTDGKYVLDGTTDNPIKVGAFGQATFKLDLRAILDILKVRDADVLTDVPKLKSFVIELEEAGLFSVSLNEDTIAAMQKKFGEKASPEAIQAAGEAIVFFSIKNEIKEPPTPPAPKVEIPKTTPPSNKNQKKGSRKRGDD